MNMKRKETITWTLVMIVLLPIFYYALFFSIPSEDDFSIGWVARDFHEQYNSYFRGAIQMAWNDYKSAFGYWFTMFNCYFLAPFQRGGLTFLRIINVLGNVLFFISLYVLMYSLMKKVLKLEKQYIFVCYLAMIFMIINGGMYHEIYTWTCGIIVYVIPISLGMLGLTTTVYAIVDDKKAWYVLGGIIGFFAASSPLNISAFLCGFYLLLAFLGSYYFKRKARAYIPFVITVISTLINLVAPGNWIRHGESAYQISQSLTATFEIIVSRFVVLTLHTPYFVILILLFIYMFDNLSFEDKRIKYKYPIVLGTLFMIGLFFVVFPVCLGYSRTELGDRHKFLLDITIYFFSFIWLFYFIGYIKRYTNINVQPLHKFVIDVFSVCFVIMLFNTRGGNEWTTTYMYKSILDRSARQYVEFEEGILKEIENSTDKDVVIERDEPRWHPIIENIGLSRNAEDWRNSAIAHFYKKEKVRIQYEREIE